MDESAVFFARRPWFVALARTANLAFFLVTATYCLLSYTPFAYQNFIRPHMIAALGTFVIWHHLWFWLMLSVTALTMVPALGAARRSRPAVETWIAWTYLVASGAVGVLLTIKPILPQVDNSGRRGLLLAVVALGWPLWLAIYDHVATSRSFAAEPSNESRVLNGSILAALFVWAAQIVAIPWRLDRTGDIVLTRFDIAFGVATSLVAHLAVFGIIGLAVVVLLRLVRTLGGGGVAEYWAIGAASAVSSAVIIGRLVFRSISFGGAEAWAVATLLAVVLTLVWSGTARQLLEGRPQRSTSMDAWLMPAGSTQAASAVIVLLAGLVLTVNYALFRAEIFDWDFLLQKLIVLGGWVLAFAFVHSLVRRSRTIGWTLAGMPVVALALFGSQGAIEPRIAGLAGERFVPEFVLDGYVGLDTSFRLIRDAFWTEPPGSAGFYRYLSANTLLERFDIAPIDNPPHRVDGGFRERPNIFLITVDSLRPDYLAPYNPRVAFTPEISRFAADSVVFTRAFTRYGGTGLSMPAIWAGSMMIHKQYVQPFAPMNLLERLLDAGGYQTWLSMDHITTDILAPRRPTVELDRGRDEMQYDVCGTFEEIESTILTKVRTDAPMFVHTRPLNLHVSKLRNRKVADDPAYLGFQGPAAAAVRRIDGCWGGFIDFLKAHDLYDSSVIVLMSDHGDSLGEDNRWGHAMTLYPEVVRIPLIIHMPKGGGDGVDVNRRALVFSTDVTPTLCALLGYEPAVSGAFSGIPLTSRGSDRLAARAREPQLLASSYGPVYGILSDEGRVLYIADAVDRRDYEYDLSAQRPVRLGVTAEERTANRALIERRLSELAGLFRFSPVL